MRSTCGECCAKFDCPGLRTADQVKAAAAVLVDAHWLREPTKTVFGQPRSRVAYPVNPALWGPEAP